MPGTNIREFCPTENRQKKKILCRKQYISFKENKPIYSQYGGRTIGKLNCKNAKEKPEDQNQL